MLTALRALPLLWLTGGAAWAGAGPPPDSTTTVALPAAVVETRRPAYFNVGTRFTRLDSAALLPTGTLADALALGTPLYVKQYGPGQLASISIRGTSARHTAVLWHGFTLNFPTLGEADFALLPTAGFAGALVQHGPGAARYGSGALGGAVVLTTEEPAATHFGGAAQLTAGSFGHRAARVDAHYGTGRLRGRTSVLSTAATNDFPYQTADYRGERTVRQVNAEQQQLSLAQDLAWQVGEHGTLTAAAWLTAADRRLQPLLGGANDHARERDASQRLLLEYADRRAASTTAGRVAYLADRIRYGSDAVALTDSRTRSWQAQLEHTRRLSERVSVEVGAEAQRFRALVDAYGRTVTEYRAAAFGMVRYVPTPRLRLTANLRQAVLPGGRAPLTPTAGAEWQAYEAGAHQWWLKAGTARAYRAPTLNERYWQPGGNPELRPETAFGYEAGSRYEYARAPWAAEAELTTYRLRVDDWVQWTPLLTAGVWAPQNLRQVRTRGVEATGRLSWQRAATRASLRAAYALTVAEKTRDYGADSDPRGVQLAYVPRHTFNAGAELAWRRWQLSAGGAYTSFRYSSASGTEFLPGYALLQASAGRAFRLGPLTATTLLQGFNLSNTRYQTMAGRPMPGRSVLASLRVAWR